MRQLGDVDIGATGWISGFGQAGSAAFPFVTGLLASRYGIIALQPLWVFYFLGKGVMAYRSLRA